MVDLFDGIDFGDGSTTSKPDKSDDLFGGIDFTASDLPAAASDAAGVPPSPEEAPPVDPDIAAIDAQIAANNAMSERVNALLTETAEDKPDPFSIANQLVQDADMQSAMEIAMAQQPDPNAPPVVPPVAVGQDGVNPVSVFNPAC